MLKTWVDIVRDVQHLALMRELAILRRQFLIRAPFGSAGARKEEIRYGIVVHALFFCF